MILLYNNIDNKIIIFTMCGISGKVYFNNKTISKRDISIMNQKISHRGPDDNGIYISKDQKIGLGHTRLSIIDLSKNGHQPMSYINRYKIVFNGEIYNFQEERSKLAKLNYKFTTNTDTEVILALYDKYDINCLEHLRGMFAFAIFDKQKQTIFCARDRIGKKPFKYFLNNDVFIFASELKAILTQPDYGKEPDYAAIHHYLTLQYCPAPMTGFKNIQKLEPAHYLLINLKTKQITKKQYWQLDYSKKYNYTENKWSSVLMNKLEESVKLRMISDVPIGAFLSGGVDSSAIVALMSQFSNNPIETFSIGFKEKKYNELKYARIIANKFKTNHHELIINPQHIDLLPKIVKSYEEPYADSSALPTYYLNKFTQKNVTATLNGDGGDENFAGYLRYTFYKLSLIMERMTFLNKNIATPCLKQLKRIIKTFFIDRSYQYMNSLSIDYRIRYLNFLYTLTDNVKKSCYTNSFQKKVHNETLTSQLLMQKFDTSNTSDKIDQVLYTDMTTYLPDDLLTKVDIASMAHGLESRSPLLDHELLELSAKIPSNLKLKGLTNRKYIFKQMLKDMLPKEILYRKKKGFSMPVNNWLKGDLKKYAYSHLLSQKFKNRNIIKKESIKTILDTHMNTSVNTSYTIWTLLMLELWFEEYFD